MNIQAFSQASLPAFSLVEFTSNSNLTGFLPLLFKHLCKQKEPRQRTIGTLSQFFISNIYIKSPIASPTYQGRT